jgi:hypothetical protein
VDRAENREIVLAKITFFQDSAPRYEWAEEAEGPSVIESNQINTGYTCFVCCVTTF